MMDRATYDQIAARALQNVRRDLVSCVGPDMAAEVDALLHDVSASMNLPLTKVGRHPSEKLDASDPD